MQDTKDLTLSVPDMSCEHCVNTINSTLSGLDGIQNVKVDLSSKSVQLQYQPNQVSLQQIETALDDAGYTVTR